MSDDPPSCLDRASHTRREALKRNMAACCTNDQIHFFRLKNPSMAIAITRMMPSTIG